MKLNFRNDYAFFADVEALHECATAYFWENITAPINTAVDIGAHAGFWTVVLKLRYPNAYVVAVEPTIANAKLFKQNTLYLNNITLHEAYCGYEDVQAGVMVYTIDRPGGAKVAEERKYDRLDVVQQSLPNRVTLEDVTRHLDAIDILKIDCEGHEQEILLNCDNATLDKTNIIVGEWHGDRMSFYDMLVPRLKDFGFTIKVSKRKDIPGCVFFAEREVL